jgi:hypothetical protein
MLEDFDRYSIYRTQGDIEQVPFIKIKENGSDKYEQYIVGETRFDKLSQKYYGTPIYDFFILMANPTYVNEFDIEDGTIIRIPFPIATVKNNYISELEKTKRI